MKKHHQHIELYIEINSLNQDQIDKFNFIKKEYLKYYCISHLIFPGFPLIDKVRPYDKKLDKLTKKIIFYAYTRFWDEYLDSFNLKISVKKTIEQCRGISFINDKEYTQKNIDLENGSKYAAKFLVSQGHDFSSHTNR